MSFLIEVIIFTLGLIPDSRLPSRTHATLYLYKVTSYKQHISHSGGFNGENIKFASCAFAHVVGQWTQPLKNVLTILIAAGTQNDSI